MLAEVTKGKEKEEQDCGLAVWKTTEPGWGPELVRDPSHECFNKRRTRGHDEASQLRFHLKGKVRH